MPGMRHHLRCGRCIRPARIALLRWQRAYSRRPSTHLMGTSAYACSMSAEKATTGQFTALPRTMPRAQTKIAVAATWRVSRGKRTSGRYLHAVGRPLRALGAPLGVVHAVAGEPVAGYPRPALAPLALDVHRVLRAVGAVRAPAIRQSTRERRGGGG